MWADEALAEAKKRFASIVDKSTGAISGYTPNITYQHPKGDAEMAGNDSHSYSTMKVIGFYEKAITPIAFNRFEGKVFVYDAAASLEWKIYVRDTTAAFTPANETAVAEGVLSTKEYSHDTVASTFVKLTKPVYVPAGKYVFVLFRATAGITMVRKWTTDGDGYSRHGFVSSVGSWDTAIGITFPPSHCQTAIKLYLDSDDRKYFDGKVKPRITLPDELVAVVGDTLQVFTRGIIEAFDPYTEAVEMVSTVGAAYPRYWEYTPTVAQVGTQGLTVNVRDKSNTIINSKTCNITVKDAVGQPASPLNVLCLGDSLTVDMIWPQELYRRLTQSGGTPAGKGYGNITFIGDKAFPNYPTQKGIGNGGWKWDTYMGNTSPLWDSTAGTFSFASFCDANGYSGIDCLYVLLGWNSLTREAPLASQHSAQIAKAKTFIDKFHLEYPDAEVRLMGLQVPSFNGGLGANYGAAYDQTYYNILCSLNGWNMALQNMVNEEAYSGFCKFLAIAPQLDSENNMPAATTKAVNTRNTRTEALGSNGVHPATEGYLQIADVAYRDFIRTYCAG